MMVESHEADPTPFSESGSLSCHRQGRDWWLQGVLSLPLQLQFLDVLTIDIFNTVKDFLVEWVKTLYNK